MQPPVPDGSAERARDRQWRLAKVNLAIACALLVPAALWWFVDDATWQPPVFSVLGVALVIGATSNVRQQRRHRRREQERRDPR